jgi:ribose transport system permease protein
VVVAVAVLVVLAVRTPAILGLANLQASITQAAPIAVVAMGLVLVIAAGGDDVVSGGIDLSLAATATLSTAILAKAMTERGLSFGVALALVGAVALGLGLVNAGLVVIVGMTPILATLASLVVISGLIRVVTKNRRTDTPQPVIAAIRDGQLLGLPLAAVLALALMAVLWLAVQRTAFGAHLRAAGAGRSAAVTAGLNPNRYLAAAFVIASLTAGFDGLLLAARGSGFSPGTEERLLVDMVLAGYLSPVFSRRGVATPPGALVAALLVALLTNALVLSRVDNSWVYGFKGALILTVVAVSSITARRSR